ncbi:hypothetical protein MTR67_010494 [Solanum verrucosum]|uniref:Uncharacterized protein n=1 Tax=Solanum verrucosum TaxID=315347 RepID=A0AAF0TFR8_SOLVR|nr:hypothetical protein MTR67_010494 [Solanum verrucosum]
MEGLPSRDYSDSLVPDSTDKNCLGGVKVLQ